MREQYKAIQEKRRTPRQQNMKIQPKSKPSPSTYGQAYDCKSDRRAVGWAYPRKLEHKGETEELMG